MEVVCEDDPAEISEVQSGNSLVGFHLLRADRLLNHGILVGVGQLPVERFILRGHHLLTGTGQVSLQAYQYKDTNDDGERWEVRMKEEGGQRGNTLLRFHIKCKLKIMIIINCKNDYDNFMGSYFHVEQKVSHQQLESKMSP